MQNPASNNSKKSLKSLALFIFVSLGLLSACNQIFSQTNTFRIGSVPISQGLSDPKPIINPPFVKLGSSSLVTTSENVVPSESGYSIQVPVLMYHYIRDGVPATDTLGLSLSVPGKNFEEQMNYLAEKGFHTVTPIDLYLALRERSSLPEKSIILTFDDGYRDFYTNAYPVLKKYGLKATVFMIADWIGRDGYLTLDQIEQMNSEGLIDIESHTLNHVDLTAVSPDIAYTEIFDSKSRLEKILNKKIVIFCYPYGAYNEQVVKMVADAGYVMAFSTRYGLNESERELFDLRRVRIQGQGSMDLFTSSVEF